MDWEQEGEPERESGKVGVGGGERAQKLRTVQHPEVSASGLTCCWVTLKQTWFYYQDKFRTYCNKSQTTETQPM